MSVLKHLRYCYYITRYARLTRYARSTRFARSIRIVAANMPLLAHPTSLRSLACRSGSLDNPPSAERCERRKSTTGMNRAKPYSPGRASLPLGLSGPPFRCPLTALLPIFALSHNGKTSPTALRGLFIPSPLSTLASQSLKIGTPYPAVLTFRLLAIS